MTEKRLIVGVSGASGAPLALRQECGLESLEGLADVVYDVQDIGAGPASGSFKAMGMIVIPCSMKTAAGIHSGYADNLLLRATDVTLKERRKLVLVAREAPFSPIHLRNLYELSRMGAVIPAVHAQLLSETGDGGGDDLPHRLQGAGPVRHQRAGLPPLGGNAVKLEKSVLGYPIRAEVTQLDDGWDVGVFGGCKTHVGP